MIVAVYYVRCDFCRNMLISKDSLNTKDARKHAKEKGWSRKKSPAQDVCPECVKKGVLKWRVQI